MDFIILTALLIVVAEVTYLVASQFTKERRTAVAPAFIDTSVLIDGRIIAIAASGFMNRPLYIPRSVVGELQFLADTGDSDKRARARHGLDIINELQSMPRVTVKIFADGVRAREGVDNRLLELAKKHGGAICTIDYNLNKVAVVEGIEVLNVNDLAKTLRMAYLPGEKTIIEITQKGNDSHQAVGHLDDGTMVVVENAYKLIGTKVEVEFTRALQTAAGKMMFAKLVGNETEKPKAPRSTKLIGRTPKNPSTSQRSARSAKQEALKAEDSQDESRDVTRSEVRPRRSQAIQASKQASQAPRAQQRKPQSTQRGGRSRRTNEDSMVELANQ